MRIALCLSGQPRMLSVGLESLKRNFLEVNDNIDIFIHAWKAESFNSAQPHQDNRWGWNSDTPNLLCSLNPKLLLIQEACDFDHFRGLENLPTAIQPRLASMFYSAWAANQLKQDYERLHQFKYDLVIKTRIDINYHKPVKIEAVGLDIEAINVPRMHQQIRINDSYPIIGGGSYSSMSDTWVGGSSLNMDKMALIYNKFEKAHSIIKPFQYGECYMGIRRYEEGLPINMVDVQYNLLR